MFRPSKVAIVKSSGQSAPASKRKSKSLDAFLNIALVATAGLGIAVYLFPIFSPELYAPSSSYKFGTIKAGALVKHTFTLRNLHPWAVTVTGITSDCGCTKAFVGRKVPFTLAPLQSVDLAAMVNTNRKHGDVSQNINVMLNNRVANSLAISGHVN